MNENDLKKEEVQDPSSSDPVSERILGLQGDVFAAVSDKLRMDGKTWRSLADELGFSRAYMSQLKSGARRVNLETLVKVTNAVGLRLHIRLDPR